MKHTVDEERPFGLKDVAKKRYGLSAAKEQEEMKASIKNNGGAPNEYYKADLDIMAKYCEQDCRLTYQLYNDLSIELIEQNLEDFFYNDEVMPLYREVTIPMQRRGIKLDIDLINKAKLEIEQDIDKLEDRIQLAIEPHLAPFIDWYLWKEMPPRRSGTFAQYACKAAGLDLPLTATGKLQVTRKLLYPYADAGNKAAQFILGGPYLSKEEVRDVQMLWLKDHMPSRYVFNLMSKHHLKKLFFEILEEIPVSTTDKGNPQVDDAFLDKMANKYPWVGWLRDYNKLQKLHGTYIQRFLDEEEDGIFYPSFMQHRTISGRYGSDLQQLPRPYEEVQRREGAVSEVVYRHTNNIRRFFIARSGSVFIDNDYESLEPHVFAHISGDELLRDIFRNGQDFYSTIAIRTEQLSGVSADKSADNYLGKVDKPLRQKAKAYSLGIPYGMSAYALGKTLGISEAEAQGLWDGYLNGFPDLKNWMAETHSFVKENGYIKSEAGRIRHLPLAASVARSWGDKILDPLWLYSKFSENRSKYSQMKHLRKQYKNALNNSLNFQIQSLSASIVNRSAIAINRALREMGIDGCVVAQIHDQLIVEVPEINALEMKDLITEIMENTYKLSISLKAPAEIGKNFADAH
jgi:DNA polymerase I-like protein with 3'-5' exonuclease and polymerase domains